MPMAGVETEVLDIQMEISALIVSQFGGHFCKSTSSKNLFRLSRRVQMCS